MKDYLCTMLRRIRRWLHRWTMFVIADPKDNSITFSKALCKHMRVMELDAAKVFVFRITEDDTFGMMLNPELEMPTQLADVQYNSKHKCIGIESLNPTVNRIFYDYQMPHDGKAKLSVEVCETNGKTFYKINRPCRR